MDPMCKVGNISAQINAMRRQNAHSRLTPDKNETSGNPIPRNVHYTESILLSYAPIVKKNYVNRTIFAVSFH